MVDVNDFVIDKDKAYSNATDYEFLLDEGMKMVAKYSGAIWTNHNHSDPGITILQNLCYTLTELGFKAEIPIHDLLAGSDEKIEYKDHFLLPEEVFTTSPVLLKDFQKLVMNQFTMIKQIYFQTVKMNGLVVWYQPLVELRSGTHISEQELSGKVNTLLTKYTNIGQTFAPSAVLIDRKVSLMGKIYLSDETEIEKSIAAIIFAINNYFSPFPVYQSYETLINQGRDIAGLLDGPFMSNGFISDDICTEKKSILRIGELAQSVLNIKDVLSVSDFEFSDFRDINDTAKELNIKNSETPSIGLNELLSGKNEVKFYQRGKQVTRVEAYKVDQYLNHMYSLPVSQDLSSLLPTSQKRDVNNYYSFQYQFPSTYQLTNLSDQNKEGNAKVLQLKGYLMLFEQFIADYLEQISQLPSLFSFRSGRDYQAVSSATYFDQPLYNVPDAKYLLKDAETFSTSVEKPGDDDKNWELYQKDDFNPYTQVLKRSKISGIENQKRKATFLKHLLARVGKHYPTDSLSYTNPDYGSLVSDEIDQVSTTLLNFENYSKNRLRSYYQLTRQEKFLSGYEKLINQEINITSFLGGLADKLTHEIERNSSAVSMLLNDQEVYGQDTQLEELGMKNEPSGSSILEVIIQGQSELIIEIGENHKNIRRRNKLETIVTDAVKVIKVLIAKNNGFLMVDPGKLLSTTSLRLKLEGLTSNPLPFDVFSALVNTTVRKSKIIITSERGEHDVLLILKGEKHKLFEGIESLVNLKKIIKELQLLKDNKANKFDILIDSGESFIEVDQLFLNTVKVFLPGWVGLFRKEEFQQYFVDETARLLPVGMKADIYLLSVAEMNDLLQKNLRWMKVVKRKYEGKEVKPQTLSTSKSKKSFIQLLKDYSS